MRAAANSFNLKSDFYIHYSAGKLIEYWFISVAATGKGGEVHHDREF